MYILLSTSIDALDVWGVASSSWNHSLAGFMPLLWCSGQNKLCSIKMYRSVFTVTSSKIIYHPTPLLSVLCEVDGCEALLDYFHTNNASSNISDSPHSNIVSVKTTFVPVMKVSVHGWPSFCRNETVSQNVVGLEIFKATNVDTLNGKGLNGLPYSFGVFRGFVWIMAVSLVLVLLLPVPSTTMSCSELVRNQHWNVDEIFCDWAQQIHLF